MKDQRSGWQKLKDGWERATRKPKNKIIKEQVQEMQASQKHPRKFKIKSWQGWVICGVLPAIVVMFLQQRQQQRTVDELRNDRFVREARIENPDAFNATEAMNRRFPRYAQALVDLHQKFPQATRLLHEGGELADIQRDHPEYFAAMLGLRQDFPEAWKVHADISNSMR